MLLEFLSPDHANKVRSNLDGQRLFGQILIFEPFKRTPESMQEFKKSKTNQVYSLKGSFKYFRFKKKLNIKINFPSKTLHVTNLPEKVTPVMLFDIFSQIHEPVRIIKLKKRGVKSNMYLIEFSSLE